MKLADYPSRHVCLLGQTNLVMGHSNKKGTPTPLKLTSILTLYLNHSAQETEHIPNHHLLMIDTIPYISLRAWSIIKTAEQPSFRSFITGERNLWIKSQNLIPSAFIQPLEDLTISLSKCVNQEQTAPTKALWSGCTLFACYISRHHHGRAKKTCSKI